MKLNELFAISSHKIEALKQTLQDLNIKLSDIQETFTKGRGSGGQKTNKTNNCVQLHHLPTGIRVSCHKERERNKNRFLALRALLNKIEHAFNPQKPTQLEKIKKQKQRRKRKNINKQLHNKSE